MSEVAETWGNFAVDLRADILPIYAKHERNFDEPLIHGRMHICRCVLFGEFMCQYYWSRTTLRPSFMDVRYATAFHDAGREANGPDLWGYASEALCGAYLAANPRPVSLGADGVARLIAAKGNAQTIEERIVHDVDVLDIMRPCCGHGGRGGFWAQALLFLGERDDSGVHDIAIREELIDEAWQLIQATEDRKHALRQSVDHMADVLNVLAQNQLSCPMLAAWLLPDRAPNWSLQPTRIARG